MNNTLSLIFLILSCTVYSQAMFEHQWDKNITISVPENAEEGKSTKGSFIRGTYDTEVVVYIKSTKGKEQLATMDEKGLQKLFHGIKEDALKAGKGILLNEEMTNLKEVKCFHYTYSNFVKDQNMMIDNYVFVYKNTTYTVQFMNNENEFENFIEFRKEIIDSINFF